MLSFQWFFCKTLFWSAISIDILGSNCDFRWPIGMAFLSASFVFTSLKVGEYGLLCFIASRGWFEVTGETENLLDGTFSRQQKVTLDSRLGPFDTLFYWATSAAFTCCPSVQKIFWNSSYTSLLSIHSRDVQNANRLGLKSICSRLDTTEAINRLRISKIVF